MSILLVSLSVLGIASLALFIWVYFATKKATDAGLPRSTASQWFENATWLGFGTRAIASIWDTSTTATIVQISASILFTVGLIGWVNEEHRRTKKHRTAS